MAIQHEGSAFEGLTFAVVVSGPSRLAFAGSPETVAALLPVHAPNSIAPLGWLVSSRLASGCPLGEPLARLYHQEVLDDYHAGRI